MQASMAAAVSSKAASFPRVQDDDDGFGGARDRARARARAPRPDEALYAEGGEFSQAPWWDTPFLEPLLVDGKRTAHDRYSQDVPLWESVSHYALMSFAVRNVVKALERYAGAGLALFTTFLFVRQNTLALDDSQSNGPM
jgi:hypothetical protein